MPHSHHGPEAPHLSTPRMALHLRAVLALPPPMVLIVAGVYSPVAFVCLAPGISCCVFDGVDASRPHISGTPTAGCYDIPPRPHTADPSVHLRLCSHCLITVLRLRLNDLCEEGRAQGPPPLSCPGCAAGTKAAACRQTPQLHKVQQRCTVAAVDIRQPAATSDIGHLCGMVPCKANLHSRHTVSCQSATLQ